MGENTAWKLELRTLGVMGANEDRLTSALHLLDGESLRALLGARPESIGSQLSGLAPSLPN